MRSCPPIGLGLGWSVPIGDDPVLLIGCDKWCAEVAFSNWVLVLVGFVEWQWIGMQVQDRCQSCANRAPIRCQSIANSLPIHRQSVANQLSVNHPMLCQYVRHILCQFAPIQCQSGTNLKPIHPNLIPTWCQCYANQMSTKWQSIPIAIAILLWSNGNTVPIQPQFIPITC